MPRDHLSIGEVLGLLKEEFPDVSISKIRFLESKGLLDPERTPSGYRKFYDDDVTRLRWILTQQRDHFLPLKVIKERLVTGDLDGTTSAQLRSVDDAADEDLIALDPSDLPETGEGAASLDEGATSVSMSAEELAKAAGLSPDDLEALEHLGLIQGRSVGPTVLYDDAALTIARHAAACLGLGLEIRHLKVYLLAAQREAGFVQQVVTPLLARQDPAARRRAHQQARDLLQLGDALRGALLRQEVRSFLGPT